jgi:hypothetical protein
MNKPRFRCLLRFFLHSVDQTITLFEILIIDQFSVPEQVQTRGKIAFLRENQEKTRITGKLNNLSQKVEVY